MFNHMGRKVTAPQTIASPVAGTKPTARTVPPDALADVALIDCKAAAAAACISVSQFHDLVRTGRAPQPAFRAPRCTRWRLADVRAWLVEFAQPRPDAASRIVRQARRASQSAQAQRAAQAGA